MMNNSTIEAWFEKQEDGEFGSADWEIPYQLAWPSGGERLIYTTKPRWVIDQLSQSGIELPVVGRYGLPRASISQWLVPLATGRTIYFLGDADPVDLLVFCEFCQILAPIEPVYLGVSDQWMQHPVPENCTIPLTAAETSALTLLRKCSPNLEDLVGPNCQQLLDAGGKVELEATAGRCDWRLLLSRQ